MEGILNEITEIKGEGMQVLSLASSQGDKTSWYQKLRYCPGTFSIGPGGPIPYFFNKKRVKFKEITKKPFSGLLRPFSRRSLVQILNFKSGQIQPNLKLKFSFFDWDTLFLH